jgi:hypothetical protein
VKWRLGRARGTPLAAAPPAPHARPPLRPLKCTPPLHSLSASPDSPPQAGGKPAYQEELLAAALHTLQAYAAGGMYDQVGGGFHRYRWGGGVLRAPRDGGGMLANRCQSCEHLTPPHHLTTRPPNHLSLKTPSPPSTLPPPPPSVDDFLHVPHFEKMLYDQPQLVASTLDALAAAGAAAGSPAAPAAPPPGDSAPAGPGGAAVARVREWAPFAVRGVLDYLLRDMTHPGGGIFSAEVRQGARRGARRGEGFEL